MLIGSFLNESFFIKSANNVQAFNAAACLSESLGFEKLGDDVLGLEGIFVAEFDGLLDFDECVEEELVLNEKFGDAVEGLDEVIFDKAVVFAEVDKVLKGFEGVDLDWGVEVEVAEEAMDLDDGLWGFG